EHGPGELDFLSSADRAPSRREAECKLFKIDGAQICDQPIAPEPIHQLLARSEVLPEQVRGERSPFQLVALGVNESIAEVFDRDRRAGVMPRCPAGIQVIALLLVAVQCGLGICPRTEIEQLAANLLCPALRGVGKEWKIGVRLGGLRVFALLPATNWLTSQEGVKA